MLEIIALYDRSEPARELGRSRPARHVRRNFLQSDRGATVCDVWKRTSPPRCPHGPGCLRIGHEPGRER